jgi:hypothetical protein
MTSDLRAAVALGEYHMRALDAEMDGKSSDTIDFIVAGPPRLAHDENDGPVGELSEVGYYIDNDPATDAKWLMRREDSTMDDDPLEGGEVSLAGPGVSQLNLEFYDGFEWQAEWDDTKKFPVAVRIQIVVEDEEEIEHPLVFAATVPIMAH